jgi:hypothetical protein
VRGVLLAMAVLLAGCAIPHLRAEVPGHDRAWIAVLSGALGPPLDKVGRHAWIVASVPGETLYRVWECCEPIASTTERPLHHDILEEVALHGVIEETPETIAEKVQCLDAYVERHRRDYPKYRLIPGPNSNTFVARAMRVCGIHAELPATAVGRDYLGPIGVAVTESGTGLQLETFVLGLRMGLREGVEVHMMGAAVGVHFWPPGITVPVNPGRIGFDFDGHANRPSTDSSESEHEGPPRPREYGLGNAWMFFRGAGVTRPDDVGGLRGFGTMGLSARALLAMGYAIGLDLEVGAGVPLGFAYGAHLYPLGTGVPIGATGWIAMFLGVGASGITGSIPAALDVPAELRIELDLGRRLRIGARGVLNTALFGGARHDRSIAHFFDEWIAGGFIRFGRTKRMYDATAGGGWFLGAERREMLSGAWWSATLGVEMNLGG